MRVRIRDLLLWQWKPSMVLDSKWWSSENGMLYSWEDEVLVREYMGCLKNVPPIRINHDYNDFAWSEKAQRQIEKGKWMVQDGFHRIYAARRLGYKTIRAEVS